MEFQATGPRMPTLSVVIPVYNERQTILEMIRRVQAIPWPKEIIVVDDGSTDGTKEILSGLDSIGLRVCFHPHNLGKGAAVKTGFLDATGDIVLVQDADLEYDPSQYPRLLEPIVENRADVVFGSRFRDHRPVGMTWAQRLANRLLTQLTNALTGQSLTDMETGYKVFRREVIRLLAAGLQQKRFGIEPELTIKTARAGFRIREVGVSYCPRTYRQGKKISWWDGIQALWCLCRYASWRCRDAKSSVEANSIPENNDAKGVSSSQTKAETGNE